MPDFSSTMITSVASAVVAGVPPCFSGPATHATDPVFAVFESLSRTTTFDGCSCTGDVSPTHVEPVVVAPHLRVESPACDGGVAGDELDRTGAAPEPDVDVVVQLSAQARPAAPPREV